MEILCPACQKKLQIADNCAGQVVKCPSCSATFQAPALPSMGPLPKLEPLAPIAAEQPAAAPFSMVIDPVAPAPVAAQPTSPPPEPVRKPKSPADYAHSFTVYLHQEAVTLIPPIGTLVLFFLAFFPWVRAELTTYNLWELGFSQAGSGGFLLFTLMLLLAAPIVFVMPFLNKNVLPTPEPVRPLLPWAPLVIALLQLVAWVPFLSYYLSATFLDAIDPATLGMKLAFRLHTLVVLAAVLDLWLQRRKRKELPGPRITVRW
jgi:hypothetical protein